MKKILLIISLAVIALFNISCEETVNPKAEFKQQYILTCIINVSSDTVRAVISRTYDVDGFNPDINNVDPAVSGAVVTIYQGNQSFQLREGSRIRTDTSRYSNKQQYYYATGIKFLAQKDIKIVAQLKSGEVLSAVTTPPESNDFKFSYTFPDGIDPKVNWYLAGEYYTFSWEPVNSDHFAFPRLSILYRKDINGRKVEFLTQVPATYIKQGDKQIPYYPLYSQADSCSFEYRCIDSALHKVANGDPNTTDYFLKYVQVDMMEFDKALTSYYSSTKGVLDNFSIRSDETVYSNINGGLGIFGCYRITSVRKLLDASYVVKLGYRWDQSFN
ncbi:MAG: DUF4249 family protein [Ignavibacteriales bacterium]